jgi:hypothetical protein
VELTAPGRNVVAVFAPRLAAALDDIIHDLSSADEIETPVGLLERVERSARDCRSGPISD